MNWVRIVKFKDVTQELGVKDPCSTDWEMWRLQWRPGNNEGSGGSNPHIPITHPTTLGKLLNSLSLHVLVFPTETGLVTHCPQEVGRDSLIHGKYVTKFLAQTRKP